MILILNHFSHHDFNFDFKSS